ncbi:MAG: hypothetical protein IJS90_03790 [Clostridia bacterium]|nr:hypothetical protein [Clostridia bacterium]
MRKHRKRTPEKQNESQTLRRRRLALSRVQARRKKEKNDTDRQKQAVFSRKLRSYPQSSAPFTSTTRGFYRFTKDFPAEVDSEGFRRNGPSVKRIKQKKAVWAAAVILTFFLSFFITKTCVFLSSKQPEADATESSPAPEGISSFLRIEPEQAAEGDVEHIKALLEEYDCSGALFEIKDVEGNIHLDEATSKTATALIKSGVPTAAYISCFKDSVSPDPGVAFRIRKNSSAGEIWTDNSGSGWLNPFSGEVKTLILDTVKAAAKLGFGVIALDNVCFPTDSGTGTAFYSGESDWSGTRNQLLRGFVSDAIANAGSCVTALICAVPAFDPEPEKERAPFFGNMLDSGAGIMCCDARISGQPKNIEIGNERFTDPSEIPYAFVLSAGEYACKNVENAKAFVVFERSERILNERDAAVFSGVSGFIIW